MSKTQTLTERERGTETEKDREAETDRPTDRPRQKDRHRGTEKLLDNNKLQLKGGEKQQQRQQKARATNAMGVLSSKIVTQRSLIPEMLIRQLRSLSKKKKKRRRRRRRKQRRKRKKGIHRSPRRHTRESSNRSVSNMYVMRAKATLCNKHHCACTHIYRKHTKGATFPSRRS